MLGGVLAAFGAAAVLSCSSGDAVRPSQPVAGDGTFFTATIELIDARPATGDELFDCDTQLRVPFGTTWQVEADGAFAGVARLGDSTRLTASVTDTARETGMLLDFNIDIPTETASFGGASATQVNIDQTCDRTAGTGMTMFPESVFRIATGTIDVTEAPIAGGAFVPAEPFGLNDFDPPGIVAGTFEFEADNFQNTQGGTLSARVRVTGCFRLNVPLEVQPVPVGVAQPCN